MSQLAFILIPLIVATELMSVPGVIYQFAEESAWISYLLSLVPGIWAVLVFSTLAMRHPGKTMIEYTEIILGKWLGKIVGLYYMYYLFVLCTTISDEIMSFITLFAQPQTPRIITITLFLLVCGIGAWLGIEVLGRCSEFLVPLNIIFVIIVSILLLPELNPDYLRPVLGHGLRPIFQGAIMPSGWSGEFFMLGFLLPYLNNPQKGRRFSFVGLGLVMIIMLIIIFEATLIGGPITGHLNYAYYSAVRYVSMGEFLERIDPVILGVWVYGGFLKTAVVLWAFALCTAQVFGLKNYRILMVPLSILVIVGSLWIFSNKYELDNFLSFTFPVQGLVTHNIIPTLILVVDLIRFRKRGNYEQVAV